MVVEIIIIRDSKLLAKLVKRVKLIKHAKLHFIIIHILVKLRLIHSKNFIMFKQAFKQLV